MKSSALSPIFNIICLHAAAVPMNQGRRARGGQVPGLIVDIGEQFQRLEVADPAPRGRGHRRRNGGEGNPRRRGGGRGAGGRRASRDRDGSANLGDAPIARAAADARAGFRGGRGRGARGGRGGRGRGRRSEGAQASAMKFLTRDDIDKLACSGPSEVVACIAENDGGFLNAFSQPFNSENPKTLKRLIKLLYLLVQSEDNQLASRIIAEIFNDASGTSVFLRNLEVTIRKMPTEDREFIRRENIQCLHYIIEIGSFALLSVPQSVMYTFPYMSLHGTAQKLSRGGESVGSLLQKSQKLVDDFSNAVDQSCPQQPAAMDEDVPDYPPPPENFTTIPVLPTIKALQPSRDPPYLRPNIIKGAYTDWEHYLDVQFRLMHEDFVAPLRDGISQCTEDVERKHLSEVRVYDGVSFCSPVCTYSGIGFQIRFDVSRLQRVNWEHSKRLIFGSLLCLSSDDFQTILFATVAKRDAKLLAEGLVSIQFEADVLEEVFQIDPDQRFVMVESTAYFEAYRHILEGLKRASLYHLTDRLPIFKRYLVDSELSPPIAVPRYLRFSENPVLRLKEVLCIENSSPDVVVTDPKSWPAFENTCLDPSQLSAFRAALTQEVSIIQGPPGTGKTYIGLKIVEALMANRQKLNNFPILVLCYTNHALDQFLEGIQKIKLEQKLYKMNIVRIGGRCKTKSLESCVLKTKIDELRSMKLIPTNLHKPAANCRREIRMYNERIERAIKSVEITQNGDKVFRLPIIQQYIRSDHLFQLTEERPTEKGREVDVWLNLWYVFEGEEEKGEQAIAKEPQAVKDVHQAEMERDDAEPNSDDEYIQVDAEAYRLEEDRMIEGEEFELPKSDNVHDDLYSSNASQQHRKDDTQWQVIQINEDKRKKRIRYGHSHQAMTQAEVDTVTNIWKLSLKNRWRLYLYWVNQLIRNQKQLIARTARLYNEACRRHTQCRHEIDAYVIQGADIVGMTTTGAAKYNHILSRIYPKVVIIEEAAEVFEAHVFTSLTPSVQQLIMIGDHKQLRPKANCYNLEKNYEFCVSLFEKLARNDFPVFTLEVQHRMRPEIATLICPSIYEKLLNHEDVQNYEHIKGVGKDLFFIDHCVREKAVQDKDRSHSNDHEADFMVALCKYLLKQGYSPSQITLLTMYRGQLLELRKRMKRRDYEGVRVAAVDDFQGEENDIILLSLVRSNSDGNIGFLKIANRVCVSLSRARMGFYVIGNLSMLRDKFETVWPQIMDDMSRKGCIGKALSLYCQNHPKTVVNASNYKDFLKCPEGGCQEKCGIRLDCGHSCPRLCHPVDIEHKKTKCMEKCLKRLECGHVCKRTCWKCKEGCLPCVEKVVKRIDRCGHEIKMPCHRDPSSYPCSITCSTRLACGHLCQELCSRPCTINCHVYVMKTLPCGHIREIPCYLDENKATCNEPCNKLLDCDHKCSGSCSKCHRGRLHVRCQSKCGRTLPCGHECDFPCTPTCPPCMKECNNYCVHSRCNRRCYEPCVPCKEPCAWQCEHQRCTRLCGERCNRPPCNEPCKKQLKCGHPCIGLCGEECPDKCRICDRDEVCEIFFGTEDEEDARFIQLEECKHLLEVEGCDTWMHQADDTDEGKPVEIQFKACPKCKTQIRRSLRYGNIVKQTLEDHERIKETQQVSLSSDIITKLRRIQDEVHVACPPRLSLREERIREAIELVVPGFRANEVSKRHDPSPHEVLFEDIKEKLQVMGDRLEQRSSKAEKGLPPHVVNNVNAQLAYLENLVKIVKHLKPIQSKITTSDALADATGVNIKDIQDDILVLVRFLMQDLLSKQQKADIQCEIYRLMSLIKLMDLWYKLRGHGKLPTLSQHDKSELTAMVKQLNGNTWKVNEEEHSEILEFITKISKEYKVEGLTEAERIEIVKVMDLPRGHWFKCPNGHIYCIGDCGGAMEEAKCPECGARIGGQRHTLIADNQLASEMDGARHAAWSEFTNIANFDPNQFR